VHDIDHPLWVKRFDEPIEIFLNRFSPSQKEIGIDSGQFIAFPGGSNIGRLLLGGPGSLSIIHLLIIFGSKGGWRDKRVSRDFKAVFKTIAFLDEIDDPFHGFLKKIGIAQIQLGDQKDFFAGAVSITLFKKGERN
jgi:hypothetical protein